MAYERVAAGQRYGRLTALEFVDQDKYRNRRWLFRCDCGGKKIISAKSARYGYARSCGCLNAEVAGNRLRKHGMRYSSEWAAWQNMRARCSNPNLVRYPDYGGRGISVCERWQSFENFYADMGPRPSPSHSIDRVDNDGNYEPNNCRWATPKEQRHNRRR